MQKTITIGRYVRNVWNSVYTALVGMRITGRYFFQKPITVQYPDEVMKIPDRYRGIHYLEQEKCIDCLACARACPIDCIEMDAKRHGKELEWVKFTIDYNKCMFCELCVYPCPKDCIHMSKEFAFVVDDRSELVYDLLSYKGMAREARIRMKEAEKKKKEKEAAKKAKEAAEAKKAAEGGEAAAGEPAPKAEKKAPKKPEEEKDGEGGGAMPDLQKPFYALQFLFAVALIGWGASEAGAPGAAFGLFAFMTLGGSLMCVWERSVVRSAFSLMSTFCGVAGLFILLGADFVGMAQILVYVGGILALLLFGVMLCPPDMAERKLPRLFGALLLLGGAVVWMAIEVSSTVSWAQLPIEELPARQTHAKEIGIDFLAPDRYVVAFELAAVLLTVALVAAVYIARRKVSDFQERKENA